MRVQTVCVLGGTGFVGGHLIPHLAGKYRRVKILTRHRERHKRVIVLPNVALIEADVRDPAVLRHQFDGCDAVINLVGILNGSAQDFQAAHVDLPGNAARACQQAGVARLLHMSALNADPNGPSLYLKSKGRGEEAVHAVAGLTTTVFRPSIIFGPDDGFFNRFATLLRLTPVLPLACPDSRFAPVYVGDVVSAFEIALESPAGAGQTLQMCGPRTYTLHQLVSYTARLLGRRRLIARLPDRLARWQAKLFEHVPGQPFTLDNYLSLQVDSVCQSDGFQTLGIIPRSVEAIMPQHFMSRRQRARYVDLRQRARHE